MGANRRECVKLMSESVEFLIKQGGYPKQKRIELALNERFLQYIST
jgi:hypothetical protein